MPCGAACSACTARYCQQTKPAGCLPASPNDLKNNNNGAFDNSAAHHIGKHSMRRVHPEFAYQSRELEGQIEGILGDPPNRKNYKSMVDALVGEYASGGGIEDVNMLAFALVDHISFSDPKGLLAESEDYEFGDPARVFSMASCADPEAAKM